MRWAFLSPFDPPEALLSLSLLWRRGPQVRDFQAGQAVRTWWSGCGHSPWARLSEPPQPAAFGRTWPPLQGAWQVALPALVVSL